MVKKIRLIGDKTTNLFCMNLKQYFNFIGTYVEIDYVYDYIYKNNFIDKKLLNDLFTITDNKENNINIEYDLVISTIKNTGSDIYIIEDSINQIKYNYEEDINIILSLLLKNNYITEDEYDVLNILNHIYSTNEYFKLLLRSKYFFANNLLYEDNKKKYDKIIDTINNKIKENINRKEISYIRYAYYSVIYDYSYYLHNNDKGYVYNIDSLISQIENLSATSEIYLIKNLLGNIYYYFKYHQNLAFEYYKMTNDISLERMSAKYYKNEIKQINIAISYYKKILLYNINDYNSWFNLGVCYYYTNRNYAMTCFLNAVKILEQKDINQLIFSEIEILVLSLKSASDLTMVVLGDIEESIELDKEIINMFDKLKDNFHIKNSFFYDERESVLDILSDNLYIKDTQEDIMIRNEMIGNTL